MPSTDSTHTQPGAGAGISPADVGSRVSVRRVLDDGREGLGDVVGELLAWDGDRLTVRTARRGDVVVRAGSIVAGRVVPPTRRPAR